MLILVLHVLQHICYQIPWLMGWVLQMYDLYWHVPLL